MAFYFKRKESPARAARRVSRERIGRALDHLQNRDRLETVHRVRKEIKKVRAILGLVRERMAGDTYRQCGKTLRAAAKHLTEARDAQVRPRTLGQLTVHFTGRFSAQPFAGIKKFLRQNCGEQTREFKKGESAAAVERLLRKANRRARDLKIKTDGWAAIRSGLRDSYRRGREACEAALKDASPEHLHQWRKQVQDLGHQLRLLHPSRPKNLRAAANELKALSRCLGDDHDLVMLQQFVARYGIRQHPGEAKMLNELIGLRRAELQPVALALGSRFYAEKPSSFCRRLETYWRAWRAGKKSED